MTETASSEASVLARRAAAVGQILEALANARRLVVLCKLVESGEATVSSLTEASGLSQSALSQHLAKMRQAELVTYRRDGQTLWYRIADSRIEQLIATLHDLFCAPTDRTKKGKAR